MHSKRTKERILRNKHRHKAWQDVERRKGDKAAIAVVRGRSPVYVETGDAGMIAAFTRGFVDMPPHYESKPNPPGSATWTTDPAYFNIMVAHWQRRIIPNLQRVSIDLIMACQKARRDAGVITAFNSLQK